MNSVAKIKVKVGAVLMASAILWLSLAFTGYTLFARYKLEQGKQGILANDWPKETQVPHVTGLPTLIFFAHPKCPCTRASLSELERLLARSSGKVSAVVVISSYANFTNEPVQGDFWRQAEAIPGVTVMADSGREARRFGIETSGHVVLFDAAGRRQFSGGITASRGHAGDNVGEDALASILGGDPKTLDRSPVFGCSLTDTSSTSDPNP